MSTATLEAARLAKADLLTEVVGEFPELQGLMGKYYALAQGEHVRDEREVEARDQLAALFREVGADRLGRARRSRAHARPLDGLRHALGEPGPHRLRQALTEERLQGRMNATIGLIVSGGAPIGALVGAAGGAVAGCGG